jgi:hypothetical protein
MRNAYRKRTIMLDASRCSAARRLFPETALTLPPLRPQ